MIYALMRAVAAARRFATLDAMLPRIAAGF